MMLRKVPQKYFLRRARFIALYLTTASGIFLLSAEWPGSRLLAQTPPINPNPNPTRSICPTGFLCKAVNKVINTPPYAQNSEIFIAIFIGINALILAALAWRAFKVWIAREAGEEYQTIVTSAVIGVIGLLLFDTLANYVMGVS